MYPILKAGKQKAETDEDLLYTCRKDKDKPRPGNSNCACFVVVYHFVEKKVEGKDKPEMAKVLLEDEQCYRPYYVSGETDGRLTKKEWDQVKKKKGKDENEHWDFKCVCLKTDKDKKPFYE